MRARKVRPYVPAGAVVCDIGCGVHAQLLRDLSPYIKEGIGIDKEISETTFGNITLKNIFIENTLPLADNSVDVVTLVAVLEHMAKPVEILAEVKRIVRPGGVLLITVPTVPNKYVGEFLAYRLHLMDASSYRDHKVYYSKKLMRRHLSEAGFGLSRAHMNYFQLGMNLFVKVVV